MRDITDLTAVKARYGVYLRIEKGLSENTAVSYTDDVDKLTRFLAQQGIGVEHVTENDLEAFVCALQDV
ncbi:MAG: site-specific integrase, partial [Muribaculaceae bacterium]|nr:site-specific integrase [Muribaculaceae bacterium]